MNPSPNDSRAHRFTYSINFAVFVTAIAAEAAVWNVPKGIDGGVIFLIVPIFLLCINGFGVRVSQFTLDLLSDSNLAADM